MMMGPEWMVWVIVAVVVLRLVTRRRRWRRDWLWYDDWLERSHRDEQLPGREQGGRHGDGRGRRGRAYRLDRPRDALENAADRLEEASARLRRKARGGRPPADARRPTASSSRPSGSGQLPGSGSPPGSGVASRPRVPARKPAETPLETLQRRFAEGHITMEQYERELDKLYGLN
ncbi:MAG: hypothetical protein P8Z36_08815 [Gemmatimonadota bacterium]